MRLLRILSLGLVVLLLTAGALSAQDEKTLVVGHAESTDSLDPARGYTQTTGIINKLTYDTLVTFPDDSAASIEPALATSWEISDDGLTYAFTLREAMFANGDPVTADDVVFSFMRLKNVQGNPSFLMGDVASIEATDASTVTITLDTVSPAFLANLANTALAVTDAAVVEANGGTDAADAASTDDGETYLNGVSAGSGPYMLASWEPQVETVLVRNENYWGDMPYFDRIIITNIPEAATQKVALESGEIDIALDLTSDQIPSLKGNPDISIFNGAGNIIHFLLMNDDPAVGGPIADPMVQEAIRYALDYEGYKALWGGLTPASPMAIGISSAYGEDHAFTRDLDKAKELLTEAGYPDGFDTVLSYPIFTFQGVNMETNAQKLQADLADIGINATLNPGELQVALEEYRNGQEALGYWFWGPDILDPIDTLSFLPGGIVADRANWTEDIADQSILDLRDQAKIETDPDARLALFEQIQDSLQANSPWAPFLQPAVQTAYRSDIEGYVWHPQWLVDLSLLSRTE